MAIKSMITTKAIASPSSCFLSMWTRIEQHSSLRKLTKEYASGAAVPTACQQCAEHCSALGCAALARSQFVSGNPQGSTIPSAPDRRHFNARRRSVRSGGLRPPCHSLQKKAFRRLSRISCPRMVKRMITTKAIAAPSSCFLSVWIRICSTPLCGSCKTNMP